MPIKINLGTNKFKLKKTILSAKFGFNTVSLTIHDVIAFRIDSAIKGE